jgi:Aldolase/RraA
MCSHGRFGGTREAKQNGWGGTVIYGNVRDAAILKTIQDLGIVALGSSTPQKSTRRGERGKFRFPFKSETSWFDQVIGYMGILMECSYWISMQKPNSKNIFTNDDNTDYGAAA